MTSMPPGVHRHPSPQQVIAALAALPAGSHVATDADNTLWAGDVGDEVVRCAATPPHAPWQPGTADLAWYLEEMETGDYTRACLYSAEVLTLVAPPAAEPVLTAAIADRVQARRWLVEALQAAAARGVHVWLVSASPRLAVEVGAKLFGLHGCPIIAVDCLEATAAPRTTPGRFAEPVPIGDGKVAAWRQLGLPQPDLALGDSRWDLPLLASARQGLLLVRACEDPTCAGALAEVA